jgi:hypothetical protein
MHAFVCPQEVERGELGKVETLVEDQRRLDPAVRQKQTVVDLGEARPRCDPESLAMP